jgi:hypothetical protein
VAAKKKKTSRKPQYRFGIGEWYGRSFALLSPEERKFYADIQDLPGEARPPQLCPFLSRAGQPINCSKSGGICSLRSYERLDGDVVALDSRASTIRATCPNRFEEAGTIYRWIGKTLLGDESAVAVGETPFLERVQDTKAGARNKARKVGRIPSVENRDGWGSLDNWGAKMSQPPSNSVVL